MATKTLNAFAPEFVPSSKRPTSHSFYGCVDSWSSASSDPAVEESVTSEELEELEACEEWVQIMAELDEMEREHLIATALAEADPSQILEVEMRALALEPTGNEKRNLKSKRQQGKQ